MRRWLVEFDGGDEHVEADDVEITASGVLVFYRLASRQDGIKRVIRGLKARLPLFFLPDMDFGARDAIFVPFFGVPAATIDAVPRLAKLTRARVVPVVIEQKSAGESYAIRFLPG